MDYEKKYKEALEWARKVMQGKVGFVLDEVLEKFSELKESEDERIRKELISFFTERAKYTEDSTFNGLSSKEIIAWLEKKRYSEFELENEYWRGYDDAKKQGDRV